ncbi:MAG: LamG-like jellyroll fold domain-containing protein [Phycisphaerales bacterium JB063]
MAGNQRLPNDIAQLLADYFNGVIEPEALAKLERWVKASPDNADAFACYAIEQRVIENALKHDRLGGLADLTLSEFELTSPDPGPPDVTHRTLAELAELETRAGAVQPVDRTDELSRRAKQAKERSRRLRIEAMRRSVARDSAVVPKPVAWLCIAALVGLIATVAFYLNHTAPSPQPNPSGPAAQSPSETIPVLTHVAFIRSSIEAQWGDLPLDYDAGLPSNTPVTLSRGMAEVVFGDGVAVIVQGPAVFEPIDAHTVRIISGKVTVEIPPNSRRFQIDTPHATLQATGSTIGVESTTRNTTLAQTFSGQAEMLTRSNLSHILEPGEATLAHRDGTLEHSVPLSPAFVSIAEYHAIFESTESPHNRWLAYMYKLKQDPSVVLLYTFDPEDLASRRVPNLATSQGAPRSAGQYVGPGTASGRFDDKPAAAFAQDGDGVTSRLNEPMDAITLAGWFWIDQLSGSFAALLHTSGTNNHGGIHWHINANHENGWAIEFVQNRPRTPHRSYWYDALSTGWAPRDLTGRWVHLALCYDSVQGKAQIFVDGQEVVRTRLNDGIPVMLGDFQLGAWDAPPDSHEGDRHRTLLGRIDSFVILNRTMSSSEITQMFEAGRPEN